MAPLMLSCPHGLFMQGITTETYVPEREPSSGHESKYLAAEPRHQELNLRCKKLKYIKEHEKGKTKR